MRPLWGGHSLKVQGLQGCEVANGVWQHVELFAPSAQEMGQGRMSRQHKCWCTFRQTASGRRLGGGHSLKVQGLQGCEVANGVWQHVEL